MIFLLEGEEEVGSGSLSQFIKEHREELACDVIVVSDTGMAAPDTPTFSYGLRGLAGAEIIVKGPSADLHSGVFGGAVANPIAALAEIIASFHDEEGRVAVRGFYDGVEPMVCFYAPRYFHILYHPSFNHAYEEDYRYGSCRFCGEHHGFLLLPGSGCSAPDPPAQVQ